MSEDYKVIIKCEGAERKDIGELLIDVGTELVYGFSDKSHKFKRESMYAKLKGKCIVPHEALNKGE